MDLALANRSDFYCETHNRKLGFTLRLPLAGREQRYIAEQQTDRSAATAGLGSAHTHAHTLKSDTYTGEEKGK